MLRPPIFVQTEDGLGEIDCAKFPLAKSLAEVNDELLALRDEEHDYKSVVIDSLDWLERLIFDEDHWTGSLSSMRTW